MSWEKVGGSEDIEERTTQAETDSLIIFATFKRVVKITEYRKISYVAGTFTGGDYVSAVGGDTASYRWQQDKITGKVVETKTEATAERWQLVSYYTTAKSAS